MLSNAGKSHTIVASLSGLAVHCNVFCRRATSNVWLCTIVEQTCCPLRFAGEPHFALFSVTDYQSFIFTFLMTNTVISSEGYSGRDIDWGCNWNVLCPLRTWFSCGLSSSTKSLFSASPLCTLPVWLLLELQLIVKLYSIIIFNVSEK